MELERLRIDRAATRSAANGVAARRSRWIPRLVLLAVVVAVVWLFEHPLRRLVDRVRLPQVEVVRVTRTGALAASSVSGTAANGYVVARTRAALSADTPGRIVELNVIEGSVVRRGDVVARLYSEEYTAALQRAEAEVAAAHVSVERARKELEVAGAELTAAGSTLAEGVADVARIEAGVRAAEAALRESQARTRLAQLELERSTQLLADGFDTQQSLDRAASELEQARAAEQAAEASLAAVGGELVVGRARVTSARDQQRAAELRRDVSTAAVAEAQSRIPVLEAARDEARATLEKTEVRAPFDGVVVLKDAEVGEVVSPNSLGSQSRGSVVTMVDFASLEVQVELPESSLGAARVGEPAHVYLDAFPSRRYLARVDRIWPTANRQKATVEVRVTFAEPDEHLRPEMGARVVFSPGADERATAAPGSLFVPADCVAQRDGRSVVFVVVGDHVAQREVALGEERAGRVLVDAGLEGGETLVLRPPSGLAEGDRVRVAG